MVIIGGISFKDDIMRFYNDGNKKLCYVYLKDDWF